ncbi:MAG: helix-turn-helix transcriptional regulator [Chloroflexota bacterium]|nr:helix-turn-helix transcriptional regulator [Chloroflexota bacterium]
MATYVDSRARTLRKVERHTDGIHAVFEDGKAGLIPWSEIGGVGSGESVLAVKHSADVIWFVHEGNTIELPWDFARHYADSEFKAKEEAAAREDKRILGNRIREARLRAGLTQEMLAGSAGIGRVTLARIEGGEHAPRLETLLAIAKGLKLPVEKLLM